MAVGVGNEGVGEFSGANHVDEERRGLEAVLDSLDAAVYVSDMLTYELIFANKYVRDRWGPASCFVRCWEYLQEGQSGPCSFCTNSKLLNDRGDPTEPYVWEFLNSKNGRWYQCRDRAIRWLDGRLVRLEIATDITERKVREERMLRTERALRRSNRFKDLFIDIIRHDLLNPAGAVLGWAELAYEQEVDDGKRGRLGAVVRCLRRIVGIVDGASKLAAVEAGEFPPLHELDLSVLWRDVMAELEGEAEQRSILVSAVLPERCVVMGSPLLRDVFWNLLSNAIKYGREGSTVSITLAQSGGGWRSCVANEGPAILPDDRESIFRRFKRVEKGAVKGTGLGLAIARRVMVAHRGRIWVEDPQPPRRGACFVVEAPIGPQLGGQPEPHQALC